MSETLAVFGGSFDPPHVAHALVAAWAKAIGAVDRVLVIPAFAHPFGKKSVAFEHRLAMCRLAMESFPFAEVCDIEKEVGDGRTLYTLEALQKRHPKAAFRLLIGSDILSGAHRWHRWDEIVALAPPLVVGRSGHAHADVPDALNLPALSSTELRTRLKNGEPTEGRLALDVATYIQTHGLYR
ncbi:MAG: nicotinate-nucleotide adenylyltransferase [Polyangiales bacterium]|jgi:nicotinate-nucleotide adenylyltransferase